MTLNLDGLDLSILGPACVAGLVVLSTHVPLGKQVLSRGIIFIDLAIAQIAGLGVILAQYLGIDEHGFGVQIAAAAAALAGAGLLSWTDRRWPEYQEPLIGTLFALAATGGLLLLADNPQGGEHLKDLLVGQILWVSYSQLIPAAVLSAALLAFMWLRGGRLVGLLFYALFALAITASVQLVGVYLVFASLIVPALATAGMRGRSRMVAAYVIGALGYVLGLGLSAVLDLPSGAMIVWTLAGCALLAQAVPMVRRSHPSHAAAKPVFDAGA
ncbi:zinc/manganese transport system permease protein [Lysobacter niastensis]|uniref:Zinc/manganese transport system permease protein n=1 Tax=Lysobacter niastensis TaxID=380629 RepID=A0ABU1WBB1_9GAMM|nr:metal ABC transporter permease [Lysobacter niastensis]MDR7134767.1 zinc/manganese transport system permease protein [Lysobacter niastensis]